MSDSRQVVLAIDPGSAKCGVAIVESSAIESGPSTVAYRAVVSRTQIAETIKDLVDRYCAEIVVIGNGTTSQDTLEIAQAVTTVPVIRVDEHSTSLLARDMFFKENPPRGLRRLIPLSLQTPSRPYDDYVAVILAKRYLTNPNR